MTDRDKMVAFTRNCTIETSCSLLPHKFNDLTDDNESHFDFSRMFSSVKARIIVLLLGGGNCEEKELEGGWGLGKYFGNELTAGWQY